MNKKMPVLFVGHGSPMNAIENNEYTRGWEEIAAKIPKPKAILSISAHWYTNGTKTNDSTKPETIYDMYGF
ncbi:MAG: 4,5-DOPA dioxygenase extradiol, partial [Acetobacterium sp.]|nr:4,5-DOPA dioxygenase extradiol [Acetobacterium sp.]